LASTQWPPASISRRPGGCGSAGGGPRPKEGNAPRRCPFLNTAGDGTQWGSPRREKHAPLFVPLGFLVPVSRSIVLGSIQSGVRVSQGTRTSAVRSVPPLNFHRDIPSLSDARRLANSTRLCPLRVPHFPHIFQGTVPQRAPIPRGFPPFAAPPPRRGHNGKLSFSFREYGRDTLVPPHSLAFRPELNIQGYSTRRLAHPLPRRCGQRATLRRAGTRRAERSSTRFHHTGVRETAPGGLPHQTHLLSEVPRCANQLVLGAYRYKNRRPRPPTRWTDMSRSSCYTLRDSKHPPFRHSSWAHPPDLVAPALK